MRIFSGLQKTLFVLTFIPIQALAQETVLVGYENSFGGKQYYVLKSNQEIKHGSSISYCKFRDENSLLESGTYSHGKKEGQWDYFYSPDTLKKRVLINLLAVRAFYKDNVLDGPWSSYYADTTGTPAIAESKKHPKKRSKNYTSFTTNQNNLVPRMTGQYVNGKRAGEWVSTDPDGKITQFYNFSEAKLIYDRSLKDSLAYEHKREPLFLGGISEMNWAFYSAIDDDIVVRRVGRDSTRAIIQFVVKRDGSIYNPIILKCNGVKDFKNEALRLVSLFSDNWLPAISNGAPVDHNYILAIDVFIHKRKWNGVWWGIRVTPLKSGDTNQSKK